MVYFCFIEYAALSVPYMQPLEADNIDGAKLEAEALFERHSAGYVAHIYDGDDRVVSVWRPEWTERMQDEASG